MWSSAAARGVLGTALMDTRWQRASSCLRSLLPSNGSRQKPRGLSHFKSAATQLSKSFLQLGHTSSISLSLYLSSIHTQTHTQKAHTLLVESWQPSQINYDHENKELSHRLHYYPHHCLETLIQCSHSEKVMIMFQNVPHEEVTWQPVLTDQLTEGLRRDLCEGRTTTCILEDQGGERRFQLYW